jgi:hypothetical protein
MYKPGQLPIVGIAETFTPTVLFFQSQTPPEMKSHGVDSAK